MVYNIFDKKSTGSSVNNFFPNQQLANEFPVNYYQLIENLKK